MPELKRKEHVARISKDYYLLEEMPWIGLPPTLLSFLGYELALHAHRLGGDDKLKRVLAEIERVFCRLPASLETRYLNVGHLIAQVATTIGVIPPSGCMTKYVKGLVTKALVLLPIFLTSFLVLTLIHDRPREIPPSPTS